MDELLLFVQRLYNCCVGAHQCQILGGAWRIFVEALYITGSGNRDRLTMQDIGYFIWSGSEFQEDRWGQRKQ